MAAEMILGGIPPVLSRPDFPPHDATPAAHLAWCVRFGSYCTRQAQLAREFNLPTSKWLRAAELAAFSASVWRERAQGIVP